MVVEEEERERLFGRNQCACFRVLSTRTTKTSAHGKNDYTHTHHTNTHIDSFRLHSLT